MKFYKAGKRVKNINELKIGKMYSVCGIVGELRAVPTIADDDSCYEFVNKDEDVSLYVGWETMMDRVHFGMVYTILKEFHPRAKTLAKLMV